MYKKGFIDFTQAIRNRKLLRADQCTQNGYNLPNNKNYNYDNTKIYIKYLVEYSMEKMNMIIIFTILNWNWNTSIKEI